MATARPLEPISGDAVVLVNELVRLAVNQRASDIHLEPKHDMLRVRLRVDGALVDVQPISNVVAPNVVSRLKVLAKMDIAERRNPQDGQIAIELDAAGTAADSGLQNSDFFRPSGLGFRIWPAPSRLPPIPAHSALLRHGA